MLNKKTYIRLFALIMALMMTVAVFAGCNNQEAIDEANANAQAAQNAADEAKKAADSLAQAAKDLADQLAAAQGKIEEQDQAIKDAQAEASKAQNAANNAQNGVDSWHDPANTTAPAVTEPAISKEPWDKYTDTANLKAFTDLKNKYLVLIADWYTAENFAALNKIFEDAAFEIYRAVDGTGLEQIINDAATKAAQVDSIACDAAKVQALIAAFGDVPTEIFTTNEAKVIAAREAFDAWVAKYETCFFAKNGYQFVRDAKGNIVTTGLNNGKIIERDIVDFAKKYTDNALDINVNSNTNSLLYAEAKIAALYQYAEDAIKAEMVAQLVISGGKTVAAANDIVEVLFDETETQVNINEKLAQYQSVLSIVDKYGVTYADCKANGKMIQSAYEVYRIFWNANGGDDTPISGAAGKDLLTGEEFVKLYVLTLYNGELSLYENTVKDYLYNKVVEFFLNSKNTSAIEDETTWALNFYADYTNGYAANGAEVITGVKSAVTFAVEFDSIDVYVNNVKVDSIPADGVKIEKDFNRVAATAATKIFALDYDKDFKGNKSLEDAYIVIDQYIVEAITELTQVYYDDVVVPYINSQLNFLDKVLADNYSYTTGNPNNRVDAYYYTYDNAFYANTAKLIALAKKAVASYKTPTYAELNAIYNADKKIENIEDQQMFNVVLDAQETLNAVTLYTGSNAAMATVVDYFNATMETVATDLYTRIFDLEAAVLFHEEKIAVAEKLDALVGIATLNDKGAITAGMGELMTDYAGEVAKLLGDAYKDATVYNAIDAVRTPARNAIMAVEYMNYDEATPLFTFATYQAANAKKEALYYTSAKAINKTAKDNKALNIIVDRDVVAKNALYELFADGADSVLKAFADIVRPTIQNNVTVGINLYEKNYSFGQIDPVGVYLEKDMREYVDYLNSLTNLAAIDAYTTTKFSLVNNAVGAANFTELEAAGYKLQEVSAKNNDYFAHITKIDKTLAEITGIGASYEFGWYDEMAKAQLDAYFALTSAVAYKGLEDCRQLAYYKDNMLNGTKGNTMPVLLASYKGAWNAAENKWNTAPKTGYEYDMAAKRTELYLVRLDETYTAICDKIAAITLLSKDINRDLATAKAAIDAIYAQADYATVQLTAADDMSLAIVYTRYYQVGQYDWVQYNANINK